MADEEKTSSEEKIEEDKEEVKEEAGEGTGEEAKEAVASSPSIFKLVSNSMIGWFKTKKGMAALVGFMVITGGLAGLFNYQASAISVKDLDDVLDNGGGGGDGKDPFAKYVDQTGVADLSGSTTEGQTDSKEVPIEDLNIFEVKVTLTWTDEPDTDRHTNQPDSFEVVVTGPDSSTAKGTGSNTHGSPGTIEVVLSRNVTKESLENKDLKKKTKEDSWTGSWGINITLTSAGDQEAMFSLFGRRDQPDNGNGWDLNVEWKFKAEA